MRPIPIAAPSLNAISVMCPSSVYVPAPKELPSFVGLGSWASAQCLAALLQVRNERVILCLRVRIVRSVSDLSYVSISSLLCPTIDHKSKPFARNHPRITYHFCRTCQTFSSRTSTFVKATEPGPHPHPHPAAAHHQSQEEVCSGAPALRPWQPVTFRLRHSHLSAATQINSSLQGLIQQDVWTRLLHQIRKKGTQTPQQPAICFMIKAAADHQPRRLLNL